MDRICLILCIELKKDPMCLLFGLPGTPETSMYPYFLCAKKYIVDCKPPGIAGWHKIIFYLIPKEYLTRRAKCMTKVL